MTECEMMECIAIPEPWKAYIVLEPPGVPWRLAGYPSGEAVEIGEPRQPCATLPGRIADLLKMPPASDTHIELLMCIGDVETVLDRAPIQRAPDVKQEYARRIEELRRRSYPHDECGSNKGE